MTPEQKERMAEGRRLAAQRKREAKELALLQEPVTSVDNPLDAAIDAMNEPSVREERRARLLEGVDPAIAKLISDEELDKIELEERSRAEQERKEKALKTVRESLRQRARVENELLDPAVIISDNAKKWLNEPVTFTVNLPTGGGGDPAKGALCFRVNGFEYQQGHTYTRPRHVFQSLHSNHYGCWLSELRFSTLNQKEGNTAHAILGRQVPPFEVVTK